MNQDLNRLYQRICDYSPDDRESAFTFTERLARENGWDLRYAQRVVEEYKKFMFLAVAAGHPVTPSEQVDQAWHLHLVYTRSYWVDFCGQVLGMPIHHGPTKGGADEDVKFCDLYEHTKASYRQLLDETPPSDIWPAAERRFGEDVDCVRVNSRQCWIVSKALARRVVRGTMAAVILVLVTAYAILESDPIDSGPFQKSAVNVSSTDEGNLHFWGLSIGAVAASFFGLAALFRGKCSTCGRTRAMKKTGNTRRGTGWWTRTQDEWKCNHCGAALWANHFIGCGGGCGTSRGCGGTTHCGGSDAGCGNSGCAAAGCGGGGCGGGGCGGG